MKKKERLKEAFNRLEKPRTGRQPDTCLRSQEWVLAPRTAAVGAVF